MPPIYVKGGVWTNVEDEILKAAVSKYGLNQWSRVASLLTKKSAKQAKARWNEWLSPSIDKSEWTKEEDEKLLGLAKLLPNQWRSIASIVHRTANQCIDRYQSLLEDGDDVDETSELKLVGLGIEVLPAAGSARVGELNIDPESKPARPDAEALADDDREMLSEARARLANTQGKKAKRKARERMLEESKRVSLLQKRRELKAAGIKVSLESRNKRNRKEFDYNADIPHERAPQEGLYAVEEEDDAIKNELEKFESKVKKSGFSLDGKLSERRERRDEKKDKQDGRKEAGSSVQAAAEIIRDQENQRLKKRKLELPPPLELDTKSSDETKTDTLSPSIQDRILDKRKQMISYHNYTSALLAPKQDVPQGVVEANIASKPRQESSKFSKSDKKLIISTLKEKLSALPKPRSQFEVLMPSFDPNEESLHGVNDFDYDDHDTHNDNGERLRKLEILRQVDQEKALQRRSQVVQKGLDIPHPSTLKPKPLRGHRRLSSLDATIVDELHQLLNSDFSKHVDPSHNPKASLLQDLDEEAYDNVHALIQEELMSFHNNQPISNQHPNVSDKKLKIYNSTAFKKALTKLEEIDATTTSMITSLSQHINQHQIQSKQDSLIQSIQSLYHDLSQAEIELNCYRKMAQEEDVAIKSRSDTLHHLVDDLIQTEHTLQQRNRDKSLAT